MKKRVSSIILCFMMLCSLLPTTVLAADSESEVVEGVTVRYINETDDGEELPYEFGALGATTKAVYISGSGNYKVTNTNNFSGIKTIINGTAVTIEGGAVNTEDVHIFGTGSLTVGGVTFTSGHDIELSYDTVDAIFGAVMTPGSDAVNISGTIAAGTELKVHNAIVSGALEFAAGSEEVESGHLTIGGEGRLTVKESATVTAAQDAKITAVAGATISGIALYDADTSTKLSDDENNSYTVGAEDENFFWLENDEKWVRKVYDGDTGDEGAPNVPGNNQYWFEYDGRGGDATVNIGEEIIPGGSRKEFTTGNPINFTLTPPSDSDTNDLPVVKVEVFDGSAEITLPATETPEGTYACAYTPASNSGFVVRVWWTTEEYNYDTFGPGENESGKIVVEVMISDSESATVTSDTLTAASKKLSLGSKTKYILDENTTQIELLITPGANEQVRDIFVGWVKQGYNTNNDGTVDYTWILSDENSHCFEVSFGGEEGNQQQSGNVEVQFDTESIAGNVATFTVNNISVTVTVNGASVSDGKVSVPRNNLGSVTFTLGNTYDAATMQVIVRGVENYSSVLAVNNNTVSLNGLDIPDGGLHFSVEAIGGGENPDPGGEDPGQTTSTAEISFAPQQGASLTVNDDGIITFTDSEKSIGTVQVYMGESTDAYTKYLSTELSEACLAIPGGTTTVKIVLKPEGDLQAQLSYGGDIREAGAISGPVINKGTYTYTIIVAEIPENDSGSRFVGTTVEFGTNLGGGEDFTAVIWNGPQVEHESPNGTISVASIEIDNKTYTYDPTTGKFYYYDPTAEKFIDVPEGLLLQCYYDPPKEPGARGESGVRVGDAAFEHDPYFMYYSSSGPNGEALHPSEYYKVEELENYEPWVYINFVFKPDYGYQVTGIGTNNDPTSLVDAGFAATGTISTFRFPVYYHNNPHFAVLFSLSPDKTDVTGAANVNGAAIKNGQNAADSGNLALTVKDMDTADIENAVSTFDITLQNVVSKGGNNGDWTKEINKFDEPITISLTLDTKNFTAADYTVYREHEGVTEELEATYNPETGELTFKTNKFSEYTIVEKTSGAGNDSPEIPPYVPPVTPPVDTPTNDKVDIPISGDDETIHVGATVSGDTITVDEIDMGQLDGVIGSDVDTGAVTIDFSGLDSAVPVTTVELPANVVKEIAEAVNDPENDAESFEIVMTSGVSIAFDADALSEKVSQADGEDITISIESHEDADLTDAQKDAVGGRPAFDINVTSGGEHISDIGGKITIGAPYELKPDEKESGLVVWYVDNEGNRERCQGSYDPIKKRMNWETDHLSLYMIDYCPSATFADLDIDAWYADSTDFVIANGLMDGIEGDKFDPNGTTSRAMIVTILWRLEGEPVVNYLMQFEDVPADTWYTEAVRWAASEKIVEGYSDTAFGPTDPITREQFATILWRYAKSKGYNVSVGENTNILSYNDALEVSEYAIPAMQWACGAGLMEGDGGNLTPKADATRAQAAALFQRFCELDK